MKVLWLCNVIIPQISRALGEKPGVFGGWLFQPAVFLDSQEDIDFYYCAPYGKKGQITKADWGKKSRFYGFGENTSKPERYDKSCEELFRTVLEEIKPDIVHIIGTEYPHAYAMTKVFNKPEATVIQIQGLVDYYSRYHFLSGLNRSEISHKTFYDLVRHTGINQQRRKFLKRGIWENAAIRNTGNIIGRTDWDKACTTLINPDVNYYYCAENIRDTFYEGKWQYEKCEKYRIFCSQGNYPVKGLHLALEALYMLKKKYPGIKLVIAGRDILRRGIRENSYEHLLRKRIKKYSLEENIQYTGLLTAEEMKEEYLKANVFISPSLIENESNSVDEAKMLGVPTVASAVGGVVNRIRHGIDGYLYQHDAPYMLCYYVDRLLSDGKLAESFSDEAHEYQHSLCNREHNNMQMLDIYHRIAGNIQ